MAKRYEAARGKDGKLTTREVIKGNTEDHPSTIKKFGLLDSIRTLKSGR